MTRLTIIGINHAPEPTGIAVYTTAIARALASSGSTVRVITGYPHYPQWRIHDEFSGSRQESVDHGVSVIRLRHLVPRQPKLLNRAAMEIHFGLRALTARWKNPDVVILVTPALLSTGIAAIRARIERRPLLIWVQDIYSLGVSESGTGGGVATRLLHSIESKILHSASTVIVIHDRFKRHLVGELGVAPERIRVIRNWSHVSPDVHEVRDDTRRRWGWASDELIVLHAGNIGAKQGLENVVGAAAIARATGSRVRFVLMGDGNQRNELENMPDSAAVQFLDPVPDDQFMAMLLAADILLVNERAGLTEMSVPSKLTSYFSTGLPVLAATDPGSVTAQEVESSGAGLRVDAGDPPALLRAAEALGNDPVLREQLGAAGRAFLERNLTPEAGEREFLSAIEQALGKTVRNARISLR